MDGKILCPPDVIQLFLTFSGEVHWTCLSALWCSYLTPPHIWCILMGLFMSQITTRRPRGYYRNEGYGTAGVIGLWWDILWRSIIALAMVVIGAIVVMVVFGCITLADVPRILQNLWTGSSGTGSGKI